MPIFLFILFLFNYSLVIASDDIEALNECEFVECLSESTLKQHDHATQNDPFEPFLSAECEPLTTVANCVNVVSGHFFQIEKDLKGTTIDPLDFIRYYDSGNLAESFIGYGFGSHFPLWATDVQKNIRHHYGMISEREGFMMLYRDKESGPSKVCHIDPRVLEKGYTNISRATASGKANFINWKAIFRTRDDLPKGEWVLQLGDGSRRTYDQHVKLDQEKKAQLNFPTESAYLLSEEIKPNGNRLLFTYDQHHGKPRLTHVKTINRTTANTLNELTLLYTNNGCTIKDSFGHEVKYEQEKVVVPLSTEFGFRPKMGTFLKRISSSQKGDLEYASAFGTLQVCKITQPRGRALTVHYHGHRVKSLSETQTVSDKEIQIYHFDYHSHHTDVRDAKNQLTKYAFDDHKRLSKLSYCNDEMRFIRQDAFHWSQDKGKEGWLNEKTIGLGDKIYLLKTFDYDERGNAICESLIGNLTGEKKNSFVLDERGQMDHYNLSYRYTDDERNLLIEKSTPEGLKVIYNYLPETNLCTTTLCLYDGKIQERTFCTYDDNGQLQKEINDDGNNENENNFDGVTCRKIKKIESVTEAGPPFGKPRKISEFYLDKSKRPYSDDKLILLKETTISYDAKGCESSRTINDLHSSYTWKKSFDDRLRLVEEQNPLGDVTHYQYDDSDNKTEEELVGTGKKIQYEYDFANRLIVKKEHTDLGIALTTKYDYNALNQLIAETDPYENKTSYEYDRMGNQKKCIKPAMQDANGKLFNPTSAKKYNALNQAIEITDENNHKTQYVYNLYGDPTKITYPDDSIESTTYYPNGWLKNKQNCDGTSVAYTYNAKGKLLSETHLDKRGTSVKKISYTYKGLLLQSKTDDRGLITTFEYDGAGRKIKENVGGIKVIHYTYDGFDRLIKKEENGRLEFCEYDGLDQLVCKTMKDENNHIFAEEAYEYDKQGNRIKTTISQNKDTSAIFCAKYSTDGSLAWREDPYQHRTSYNYNHAHNNSKRQKVKATTTSDPLNRITKEEEDTHHRLSSRQAYDKDKLAQSTAYSYDAMGHLTKIVSKVIDLKKSNAIREYTIVRAYNKRGLLESETEGDKKTTYKYDSMNRLSKKIKPDKVTLNYTYDALGYLKAINSSDETINSTFVHDSHGNLTQAHDKVRNRKLERKFDPCDRLEWEETEPGIRISYQYDPLDRPTKMILPDQSSVAYTYDPFHLNKINRFDASGKLRYTIDCEYDLQGRLIQSKSPAGTINTTYDLLGRAISFKSPHWESALTQFDPIGNLLHMTLKDPSGTLSADFTYDRLDHLQSESPFKNQFQYDSLGNCLSRNDQGQTINKLNQLTANTESIYNYDGNGNLKSESLPSANYTYDALDRLTSCENERQKTTYSYDALDRCVKIQNNTAKHLLYQGNQEIGSLTDGTLQEFRLIHPQLERTLAIELAGIPYFPIQDAHRNICALQNSDGTLAQWIRYSAFGEQSTNGLTLSNPWRFAGLRETSGLILFHHRFYNPRIMRWLTPDPIGFKDGLNLYAYAHNNPFVFRDPDGRHAAALVLIEVFEIAFGVELTAVLLPTIAVGVAGVIVYGHHYLQSCNQVDATAEEQEDELVNEPRKGKRKGNDNAIKGGPPRDEITGNYLPDPAAEGAAHTTLGVGHGRKVENYPQGATFENEEFKGRTDVTDHGRGDHPNPHFHPATSPNSAKTKPQTIEEHPWKL